MAPAVAATGAVVATRGGVAAALGVVALATTTRGVAIATPVTPATAKATAHRAPKAATIGQPSRAPVQLRTRPS